MANYKINNEFEEKNFFREFEIDGKRWSLPLTWAQHGEGFRNFKARPDDVWIVTHPRSGTTITQELVWLLANNLDFETAKKFHLVDRSPEFPISLFPILWQQCHLLRPSRDDPKALEALPVDASKQSYEVYEDLMSPRIFKTHLALSVHKNLLDSGCKIVYTARNPKDTLVSIVRFVTSGLKPLYQYGIRKCMEDYIAVGGLAYGPYWEHIKEAWALRDHPNLLFLFYEDLRNDLPSSIRKVAKFLGKNCSEEEVAQLVSHLHIDAFRENPMVNGLPGYEERTSTFIGKGRVGGWHEIVTPEFEAKIDRWIEDNVRGTDIAFSVLQK